MDHLCVLVVVFGYGLALDFSPVDDQIGLTEVRGKVAAYADFDADKSADLLLNSSDANGRWRVCSSSLCLTMEYPWSYDVFLLWQDSDGRFSCGRVIVSRGIH